MTWFPVGPDFVYQPRREPRVRLSRRNEGGSQGMSWFLALEPGNPNVIYSLDQPGPVGRAMFRTFDGGSTWDSIGDEILETDAGLAPNWLVVHPSDPALLFVATTGSAGQIWASTNRGDAFAFVATYPRGINCLALDPRAGSTPSDARLFVGTDAGLFYSSQGGASPTQCSAKGLPIAGRVSSISGSFEAGDAAHVLVGTDAGVFRLPPQADPITGWVVAHVLPTRPSKHPLPFPANRVLIDHCPHTPQRFYAFFFKFDDKGPHTIALMRTDDPAGKWTLVQPTTEQVVPGNSDYGLRFAVAPNSRGDGDGENDILFFTQRRLGRSVDGGRTWSGPSDELWFHDDAHAFAFAEVQGEPFPWLFEGSDGGVARSKRFCDPSFDMSSSGPFDYGEGPGGGGPATFENLNHGRIASAIFAYATHPSFTSLGYISCQDTGVAGGIGLSGWRTLSLGDVGAVAAAPGTHGVNVFSGLQVYSYLEGSLDTGSGTSEFPYLLDDGNAHIGNDDQERHRGLIVGADGCGYAGAFVWTPDRSTTLKSAVGPGQPMAVPVSMAHIHPGTQLAFANETVTVLATWSDRFLAHFTQNHSAGEKMNLASTTTTETDPITSGTHWIPVSWIDGFAVGMRVTLGGEDVTVLALDVRNSRFQANVAQPHSFGEPVTIGEDYVVRARPTFGPGGAAGVATAISQNFNPALPRLLANNFAHPDTMYLVTSDNRVWRTLHATTADPSTVWDSTAIAGGFFVGRHTINAIAVDRRGVCYVLLSGIENVNGVSTPLFVLSHTRSRAPRAIWIPQPVDGLPGAPFHRLTVDPSADDLLYGSAGANVFRIARRADGVWAWTDIGAGRPREGGVPKTPEVQTLVAVNANPAGPPKVLLRAGLTGRGVWETDVTAGGTTPDVRLYVRKNILDDGWIVPAPSGRPHPYEVPRLVTIAECTDLKFDASIAGTSGAPDFFQTDGAAGIPLSHTWFEELHDARDALAPGKKVRVHVQVHNRALTRLDGVAVWVLYTSVTSPLPRLGEGSTDPRFSFWSQFSADGSIRPALPKGSLWQSLGDPETLDGLDASNPQVATWPWTVPHGFDPDHHAFVVLVHHARSQLGGSILDVETLASTQPQVGLLAKGNLSCDVLAKLVDGEQKIIQRLQAQIAGLPPNAAPALRKSLQEQLAAAVRELNQARAGLARCKGR